MGRLRVSGEIEFDQTALFQLNLMLFLSWPSAPEFVTPVFWKEGFEIGGIEGAVGLSLETFARARASGLEIQQFARPDLRLESVSKRQLLLVECKKRSFGPLSSTCKQARALLACPGPSVAEYVGLPGPEKWNGWVIYAVSGSQEALMRGTLQTAASELAGAGVSTAGSFSLGIYVRAAGVYLEGCSHGSSPLGNALGTPGSGVMVMQLHEGEDPRPLYLIPFAPGASPEDGVERRILEERVRQSVAAAIGGRLDCACFEVTMDEILRQIVPVWEAWEDTDAKRYFRNAVRAHVRRILRAMRARQFEIEPYPHYFAFKNVTREMAHEARRWLSSSAFLRGDIDLWSDAVQLDFSDLTEGW